MFRKVILYGLYIIAVGVLAGVIVKSFYPNSTNTSSSTKKTTQSTHASVAASKSKSSVPKPKTIAATPTTDKKSVSKTTQSTPQPAPTELENTGPGNLIGIFAVAFVVGTIGYHTYLRNRHVERLS